MPGGSFANPNGLLPDPVNGFGGTGGGFVVSGASVGGPAPAGTCQVLVIALSASGEFVGSGLPPSRCGGSMSPGQTGLCPHYGQLRCIGCDGAVQ